ncbi:hypothetical protein [Cytobacillus firmus]|uniref:hypothetical protein n=1 Tax=Cytobacillus firmus TaxID=1399 RepID=UPI001C98E44A|nr:hypothetical protein [Cytobacillus firmus]MBY6051747.1 hypothetical protein [Cytobacillus firmus]
MKNSFLPLMLKIITVSILIVTLPISSFSKPAAAIKNVNDEAPFLSHIVEQFNEQTNGVGKKQEKNLLSKAKKHLKEKENLVILKHNNLDFNNALVKVLENGKFFVRVANKGKNEVENFNSVAIIFNQEENIDSIVEVNLEMQTEEKAELKTWLNGDLVDDVKFDKPDVEPQWSWKVFQDCLSSKGISWAIVSALGFLCGAACIATAGAACVGCLLAAGSVTSGTISYCVGAGMREKDYNI